jgi:hypothetical protein
MINELLTQDTNMQTDRRAILTLVALGRITAAEAERLLLALNAGREGLWVPAACLAATFMVLCARFDPMPWFASLAHIAHSLLPGTLIALHQFQPLFTHLFGGIL